MTHNRGYTLLEILLSLIIVAILSLVFVGVTQKILQRNQIRSTALQMTAITNAAVNYYQMYNDWPATFTPLNTLLNQNPTTTNLSCSPWKNGSSCVNYLIASTATSKYFAVTVTTPSATIATRLAAQLPTAYSSGATVTVYATTFSGLPPTPIPSGVTLSASSFELGGICDASTYSNPFGNCFSSTATPYKPYGLIDLYAQPRNTIVSENVATVIRSSTTDYLTSFTAATLPKCPSGLIKSMVFLPVGVRTTVAANAMFSFLGNLYQSNSILQMFSIVGGTTAAQANNNVVAGVGDIVCIPEKTTGWPAG